MADNYLSNVILFSNLNKEERVSFLYAKLKKNGFSPKIQNFFSSFGEGRNIFAEINNDNQKNKIVLSAHYDGESLFDNAGGVNALLDLSKRIRHLELPFSVVILFTDQEEIYQQGAAHFINEKLSDHIINKNINIDGFGIGDELFCVSELTKNTNNDNDLFLCDSDEFLKKNIPSISHFSAFKEDFKNAKNSSNIYLTFKKYNSISFFKEKYNNKNIDHVNDKLCQLIFKT
ncbi:MAG: M28 family peptidase [Candidatus Marinimicrobia bacterium]|nr:M28 family peptidase [Candidatus Neomarinimicrobiota bacterium]